jgi:uracil-DNA glycosylase
VDGIDVLHRRIRSCRLCEDAGLLQTAVPVVVGRGDERMMLVGQAPGVTERHARRPFHGRSGRELFRWMASIDIQEDEFRRRVYMTAITKCYPGPARSGSGDRRPSAREVALCGPFLESQLALVRPAVLLLVGGMAIERFIGKAPLIDLIGRRIERDGRSYIPLPHPSGASRWLNQSAHRLLLGQSLQHVKAEWERLGLG